MIEWFLKGLKEAVQEEHQHQMTQLQEWKVLPLAEQRKKGFLIYPVEVINQLQQGDLTCILFRTSFPINDTWIKKGTMVQFQVNETSYTARVQSLEAQSGTLTLADAIEENLKEVALKLFHIPDDRTFQCMEIGLRLASELPRLALFMDAFMQPINPKISPSERLNASQQLAFSAIVDHNIPALTIQGPPGTGKSLTLSLAIQLLVKQGKKILITAPSNTAVNELSKKLISLGIPIMRVGNEEKIDAELLAYTIEGYLEKGSYAKTIQQLQKSAQQQEQLINRFSRNYTSSQAQEKRDARNQLKQIRSEIRAIRKETTEQLIATVPVIAGTPVGLFNHLSKHFCADVVIMDEAGQALSPLTWLVASFGERLVLCGDPQQLPPTVLSNKAIQFGLGKSVLERSMEKHPPILLQEQFRMSSVIAERINHRFYGGQLITKKNSEGNCVFIDTAGYGDGEYVDEETGSIMNLTEIEVVQRIINLYQLNSENTIIIAPYNAQIAELQAQLGKKWHVSTIDSVQGQEASTIVISLTRSNPDQVIGFLTDYRRTNVAISRAKDNCFLIGDSTTLGGDRFYNSLIQEFENTANYKSIWELIPV